MNISTYIYFATIIFLVILIIKGFIRYSNDPSLITEDLSKIKIKKKKYIILLFIFTSIYFNNITL